MNIHCTVVMIITKEASLRSRKLHESNANEGSDCRSSLHEQHHKMDLVDATAR